MPNELKSAAGAIPAAGLVAVLSLTLAHPLAQAPATAPFPAYRAPRAADGRPDLNGIWQSFTTANWDIQDHEAQPGPHPEIMATYGAGPAGQGIVEGNEIPYQPWALAKKKENFEKRTVVDVSRDDKWHDTGDPELKCYLPGVPRATYMPFPFQIVQGPGDFIPDRVRICQRDAHHPHELEGRGAGRFVDGMVARSLGGRHAGCRRDRAQGRNVVRPGRKFSQRRPSRGRTLHAGQSVSSSVRSNHRRSEGVHATLEDQPAALPSNGASGSTARIQVRAVQRGIVVRAFRQAVGKVKDGGVG